MNKKLFSILLSLSLALVVTGGFAADPVSNFGDVTVGYDESNASIGGGDVIVRDALTVSGAAALNGGIDSSVGILNINEAFLAVPVASTGSYAATSGIVLAETLTTANVGELTNAATSYIARDLIQPSIPMSLYVTTLSTMAQTITVVGVDAMGEAVTESFTTVAASTKTYHTNNAFSYVTSISVTATAMGPYSIAAGLGLRVGLANDITATADVYHAVGNAVDDICTPDATYDTVTFATAPNGTYNYMVWYKAKGRD